MSEESPEVKQTEASFEGVSADVKYVFDAMQERNAKLEQELSEVKVKFSAEEILRKKAEKLNTPYTWMFLGGITAVAVMGLKGKLGNNKVITVRHIQGETLPK